RALSMLWRVIAAIVAVVLVVAGYLGFLYVFSTKERYELSERCGRTADALMKREYEAFSSYETRHIYNQRNHYNARLNKCFLVLVHFSYPAKNFDDSLRELKLIDLHENKDYGWYLSSKNKPPTECSVQGKFCNSESEWFDLVAPFM